MVLLVGFMRELVCSAEATGEGNGCGLHLADDDGFWYHV